MTADTPMLLDQFNVGPAAVSTSVMFTLSVPSLWDPPLTGSTVSTPVALTAISAHVGLPGTSELVAASAIEGLVPIGAGLNAEMRFNIRNAARET
jgi:hypothetical protein